MCDCNDCVFKGGGQSAELGVRETKCYNEIMVEKYQESFKSYEKKGYISGIVKWSDFFKSYLVGDKIQNHLNFWTKPFTYKGKQMSIVSDKGNCNLFKNKKLDLLEKMGL